MIHPNIPVLTQSDLRKLEEHQLLQLWCVMYEMNHPAEVGRKALSLMTGISESSLKNILAGRGSIGGLAWLKIQKELPTPLYPMWLSANQ